MLTPISLYHLERNLADDFLSKLIAQFDWFIFIFYGDLQNPPFLPDDLPILGELASSKVVLVDFLPITDDFRTYLYSDWKNQAPSGIDCKTIRFLQNAYETPVSNEQKACLERLFYNYLFKGDSYQPGIAIANIRHEYFVRRKFIEDCDYDLPNRVMEIINLINLSPDSIQLASSYELGKLLTPQEVAVYKPRQVEKIQNIDKAFANFLDTAEDALYALNSRINYDRYVFLEDIKINCAEKFVGCFNKLSTEMQARAIITIKTILYNGNNRGLRLEKIRLSKKHQLVRVRINNQYRIHFTGTIESPFFINIGTHKLSDFGYVID
jgi:hypothetical protein